MEVRVLSPTPPRGSRITLRGVSARLSDSELRDWYSFIRAHHAVIGRLGADLEREHGMSLGYYEVLLALSRAPEHRLRMTELAKTVFLSPSGLTRLVDRLARDGLVERRPCAGDARATYATLTDHGNQVFQAAARTHVRGIRDYFLDKLAPAERAALRKSLEALSRCD
jgi:DNA-binding MarR family transcriptional regulator